MCLVWSLVDSQLHHYCSAEASGWRACLRIRPYVGYQPPKDHASLAEAVDLSGCSDTRITLIATDCPLGTQKGKIVKDGGGIWQVFVFDPHNPEKQTASTFNDPQTSAVKDGNAAKTYKGTAYTVHPM